MSYFNKGKKNTIAKVNLCLTWEKMMFLCFDGHIRYTFKQINSNVADVFSAFHLSKHYSVLTVSFTTKPAIIIQTI